MQPRVCKVGRLGVECCRVAVGVIVLLLVLKRRRQQLAAASLPFQHQCGALSWHRLGM